MRIGRAALVSLLVASMFLLAHCVARGGQQIVSSGGRIPETS